MFIVDLRKHVGEVVKSQFLVKGKAIKPTKKGDKYIDVILADKTGEISAKIWPEFVPLYANSFSSGDVICVEGKLDEWRGNPQIVISSLEKLSEDQVERERLVRTVENPDEIYENILNLFSTIKNPWITSIIEALCNDESFIKRFKLAPGAKSWHNAYIGGLMEHTYEVMGVANYLCQFYKEADRDLVILGAFLHDIGKIYELDPTTFEYTLEGGLIGHISIGSTLISDYISKIKDFPEELRLHILHIILSHHGEYDQQSPVLPKTLESTIVYHVDDLVSQTNAVREIQMKQKADDKIWGDYISIKNRKYLVKELNNSENVK